MVPEIVALIEELIAAGRAYEAGGDVYFRVRSYARYGELSGQRVDKLEAGARVEPGEHKRDPLDFTLWKANKPDEDTWWDSPWGRGRPGWHIECSAMAEQLLGRELRHPRRWPRPDLPAPRERARPVPRVPAGRSPRCGRTTACCGCRARRCRSRSGNIDPLYAVLDRWGREAVLMLLLRAHYASPMDYDRRRHGAGTGGLRDAAKPASREAATARIELTCAIAVDAALDDDFNTPRALALLFDAPPEAAGNGARAAGACSGWAAWLATGGRPPELSQLAEQRVQAARTRATSPRPTGCGNRSRRPAGRCATPPDGFQLYPDG